MPFKFSMIAVMACAAIAVVPSVETLEHSVLDSGGNAQPQDLTDHVRVGANRQVVADHDLLLVAVEIAEDPDSADHARQKSRERRACNAQRNHKDQKSVARNVHHICDDTDPHGEFAVPASPIQPGAALKQRKEGIREHRDPEIDQRSFHYFLRNLPEDQGQERPAEQKAKYRNTAGQYQDNEKQLFGCFIALVYVLLTKVLRTDHCAARRQRGKYLDHQHVDGIREGDS